MSFRRHGAILPVLRQSLGETQIKPRENGPRHSLLQLGPPARRLAPRLMRRELAMVKILLKGLHGALREICAANAQHEFKVNGETAWIKVGRADINHVIDDHYLRVQHLGL